MVESRACMVERSKEDAVSVSPCRACLVDLDSTLAKSSDADVLGLLDPTLNPSPLDPTLNPFSLVAHRFVLVLRSTLHVSQQIPRPDGRDS